MIVWTARRNEKKVATCGGATAVHVRNVSVLFHGKQEIKEFAITMYGLIKYENLLTIRFPFIEGWCFNG